MTDRPSRKHDNKNYKLFKIIIKLGFSYEL